MTGGVFSGRKIGLDRIPDLLPVRLQHFSVWMHTAKVLPATSLQISLCSYILWFTRASATRTEKLVKNCFIFLKKGIDFIENIAIIG